MDKKTFDKQYERAASYDEATDRLTIELTNDVVFIVPRKLIQGLADAAPDQVAEVKVMPRGAALHWEDLDVQMSVPALVAGTFGSRAWMSELGRHGGSATSEAKTLAVRENGKKGGRPRSKTA